MAAWFVLFKFLFSSTGQAFPNWLVRGAQAMYLRAGVSGGRGLVVALPATFVTRVMRASAGVLLLSPDFQTDGATNAEAGFPVR